MDSIRLQMTDSQLTDSEIVDLVIQGEKAYYELLMRRNNQKLYRVLRGYIKSTSEIEDVMQDTYVKAYEKLDKFKHKSNFSTWVIRIAINEALQRIKQKGRIRHIYPSITTKEQNKLRKMDSNSPSPEKLFLQKESARFIEKTIDILEPKYKIAFIMKEVEGMSIKEIADCLDLTESNVKVRLHRAKAILKEKLMEMYIGKEIFEFGFSRCDNVVNKVMNRI